jgi:hypothetical protein
MAQRPAKRLHDRAADGQPYPEPFSLGSDEWVKHRITETLAAAPSCVA